MFCLSFNEIVRKKCVVSTYFRRKRKFTNLLGKTNNSVYFKQGTVKHCVSKKKASKIIREQQSSENNLQRNSKQAQKVLSHVKGAKKARKILKMVIKEEINPLSDSKQQPFMS